MELTAEQLELRGRLGTGARYDAAAAPHADLLLARQGTAFFLRKLQELRDEDFEERSRLRGWSRGHLIAHVGYNARGLARLAEWARTGIEKPMYASRTQRDREIASGATLPHRALRHLVEHASIHLNVEWRDLEDAQWEYPVTTAQGREVPVRATAWMRAREVWVHAIDLGTGAAFHDLPGEMLDRLIDDVFAAWRRRGDELPMTVIATDRSGDQRVRVVGGGGPEVVGTAAAIARWLTRGEARGLRCSSGGVPAVRHWF